MFFANVTTAFGQLHGAGILKSCTSPVIVCDNDAECSGASGECQENKCDTSGLHATSCIIQVTNLDGFGDTIRVNSAFDLIGNAGGPTRNPTVGNLQIIAVSGTTTCVVGGSLPCDLQTTNSSVTFASSGYNPVVGDPNPLVDQGNAQVQDLCNIQPAGCSPEPQNIQFGASTTLVSGCSVVNKADSTACTDTVAGDCKVAGCEAGVCVQTHSNAADSTACTTTADVAGDCGTPGCEAGVCVADHVPVSDSTPCSVGVTGTPDECKTPGCEAGVCVAAHNNLPDSTVCTDTTPACGFIAGCEAGSCVQEHTAEDCPVGQGCTPGFWKANADKKDANAWPVDPNTKLGTVFTIPPCLSSCSQNFANLTLRQALSLQGGNSLCEKAETLLRIATGSFLNASSSCVQFNLNAAALVAEVNGVLASCDANQFNTESTRLDAFNNQGCPLNQQGQCSNP